MALKLQVVTLRVVFDDESHREPYTWDWNMLVERTPGEYITLAGKGPVVDWKEPKPIEIPDLGVENA